MVLPRREFILAEAASHPRRALPKNVCRSLSRCCVVKRLKRYRTGSPGCFLLAALRRGTSRALAACGGDMAFSAEHVDDTSLRLIAPGRT